MRDIAMPVDAATAKSVFLAALEKQDPIERAAYLDQACAGNPALRGRIEALLRAHDDAGDFTGFVAELAGAFEAAQSVVDTPDDPTRTSDGAAHAADISLSFLAPPRDPANLGRLDHYEVLSVLGQGGMGVVLKALDESLDRIVAIKVLGSQYAANGTARRRFIREAKAVAAVTHENVVHVHTVDERVPYIVMQYIKGVSLQDRIDQRGPLEIKEILRIGMQIAAGLAAAHAQGIVHRDVKPSNILLENGVERVKLTDFGLARAVDDASVTQSGVIAGTPMYMSPEQARGEVVDPRSDLFSLGSVLYAMCTGHAPFRASGTMAVMKRVIEDSPRSVGEVNADVPDWLEAIVFKLLEKRPADRFQSAKELATLLEQHLAHLQQPSAVAMPAHVQPPRRNAPPTPPQRRKNRGWVVPLVICIILAVTCVPLLGVGALFFLWSSATSERSDSAIMDMRPEGAAVRGMQADETLRVVADDKNLRVEVQSEAGEIYSPPGGTYETAYKLPPGRYHVRVYRRANPSALVYQEWLTLTDREMRIVRVDSKWTQLFNGKDLTDWKVVQKPSEKATAGFDVVNGVLVVKGQPQGYLRTINSFERFRLQADYRLPARLDGQALLKGGLLWEIDEPDKVFPSGMMLELQDDARASCYSVGTGRTPAITGLHGQGGPTLVDGWNRLILDCSGGKLTVEINGKVAFSQPNFQPKPGKLSLVSMGAGLHFRKIEIKEPSADHAKVPALTPAKMLEHMVGSWLIEYTEPDSPARPGGAKGTYVMVVEPIAGGRFYRILNKAETGGASGVVVVTFEKDRGDFLNWYFDASGYVSNTAAGRFDSATNTLTMTNARGGDLVQVWQEKIVDADTGDFSVAVRDKMGRPVFEMHGIARRQAAAQAIDDSAGPKQTLPKEMEPLDRLIGAWDAEMTSKISSGGKWKSEITGRKIFAGRFIEIRERFLPTGGENYTLVTYDVAKKCYRQWRFSSGSGPAEGTGTWDEATKTMTWECEGGTASKMSLVWKFVAEEKADFKITVKNRDGKVLEDLDGTQTRRPANK